MKTPKELAIEEAEKNKKKSETYYTERFNELVSELEKITSEAIEKGFVTSRGGRVISHIYDGSEIDAKIVHEYLKRYYWNFSATMVRVGYENPRQAYELRLFPHETKVENIEVGWEK